MSAAVDEAWFQHRRRTGNELLDEEKFYAPRGEELPRRW
jgi:hypothetical protein